MDAQLRHTTANNVKGFFDRAFGFLGQDIQRHRYIPSAWKNGDIWKNAVKPKATQTLHRVGGAFMNLAKTKIGKGGMALGAGLIAWNLIQHSVKASMSPQPAIPRNYDRGYDILRDNMTDFGSPVKLAKAAAKTITPYKSAVRRGTYTTCRSIRDSNVALKMSDNAIRHHHY